MSLVGAARKALGCPQWAVVTKSSASGRIIILSRHETRLDAMLAMPFDASLAWLVRVPRDDSNPVSGRG